MRTLALLLLLTLQAANAVAETQADTSVARVVQGGRWTDGAATGAYRIVVEEVGFEHVSCRVRIQWIGSAADGRLAKPVAEQTFAELSTTFWSCGQGKQSVLVGGNVLKVQATHAYSGESCTFTARLGKPGRYQYEGCSNEKPATKAGG
ncbi:hypothetical protein [Achromobacter sp. Marseille-Q4954]|uniref:hypothetical protein n=1 Tax=Achromobacter sp. Marseille-Q4954 TaxID=2942203 RepID=UPI002074A3C0|nr:hypothetical protein [Achromobacter sp. Marseille-Q4954]